MNEGQSFLNIIKGYLTSNKAVLPAFNATGMKIQREASKAEPDNNVIEKMITCDPALTSQVLRIANSAFYKGLQKVSTVGNAIVRLGSQEIANIAILASQKKQFCATDPFIDNLLSNLWRHSVGTAISAQWIANRTGLRKKAQEAFTAGLLHDMGKLLILIVTDRVRRDGTLKQMPSNQLLNEVMNNFHCLFGYALLRHWNLPERYSLIARNHHDEEPDKDDDLMLTVRLADKATNCMGIGLKEPERCVLAATFEADYFGLSEIVLAELEIKLEDSKVLA